MRVDCGRIGPRQDVISGHHRQSLIDVARVLLDIFVIAAPAIVLQRILHDPIPGGFLRGAIFADVPLLDPDQLRKQPYGSDNHSAVLFAVDYLSGSGVQAERPGGVGLIAGADMCGQRVGTGEPCPRDTSDRRSTRRRAHSRCPVRRLCRSRCRRKSPAACRGCRGHTRDCS